VASASKVAYKGTSPSCLKLLTSMAKPGRNDPCPCGSGKKYKKCCLPKGEARADAAHAHDDDEIAVASHVVVELVQAGKLADADAAARDLIKRYPNEPEGWDCLGTVHEAGGENRQAAECYRKMRDIMRRRPDDYDQSFETEFAALIDKLDPPVVR
jgi:hypothetical protein